MPDLSALTAAASALRDAADQARSRVNGIDAELSALRAERNSALRMGNSELAALDARAQALQNERNTLVAQRDTAVAHLHDVLGGLVGELDPAAVLEGLDATIPVALLPVRMETRFNPDNAAELLVRILPDDIHGDSHEPELTSAEVAAGQRYWNAFWSGDPLDPATTDAERVAWADLVGRTGINRAAWIAKAMTPTNVETRPAGTPAFPAPPLKGDAWTRAAWTTVLPDRWVVLAYRDGTRIATAWGSPVPDHVHMGPDPSAKSPSAPADGKPRVDDGLQWVIDFAAAEAAGLGVRVQVPAEGGLDRLVAFGIRSSLAPADAASRVASLFDAHHYTGGLSIVPPDTPTNNTPSARAGWTAKPTAAGTFSNERHPAPLVAHSCGTVLANALGIDASVFASIAHAVDDEQTGASSMGTLLFEATLGYFLAQLMQGYDLSAPGPSEDDIASIRRHFIDYVRGRGSLPVLRVGNQPYGVLPVTSLDRWAAFDEDVTIRELTAILRALQLFWRSGATRAPHLGGSSDIDGDFVHALTLAARSEMLNVRTVQSPTFCRASHSISDDPAALDPCGSSQEIADAAWAAFDLRGGTFGHAFHPRISDMTLNNEAPPLRLPLADATPGPSTYLEALRTESLDQISTDATHISTATTVLGTLARHSVLLAYGAAADELGRRSLNPPPPGPLRTHVEPEIFGAPASAAAVSPRFSTDQKSPPLQAMSSPIAGVTNSQPAGEFLRANLRKPTDNATLIQINSKLLEIDAALADLAKRAPLELEALLMETLDTVSHRFDAWVTSLATRRLTALRKRNAGGVYVGGFGWILNLARSPVDPIITPPEGENAPLRADVNGGGYIHAPTINQASAGAVLRSAHLSHAGTPSDGALSIDLSSRRVCLAMEILDGVRAGQPLGALLGYRLERNLHEGHAPLELDRYIAPLRRLAPLVGNSVTAPKPGEPLEAIAARNVVDGLALVRLPRADVRAKVTAEVTTPPATQAELDAVMGEVDRISDAVDALSDVMLSDSVFSVIQGNTGRTAMTIDAINRGAIMPDPDVVRTHRSGTAVAHRVFVFMPAAQTAPAPGWQRIGPRSAAEPRLDAWAGRALGDPARVRVRAAFHVDAANIARVDVALSQLVGGPDGMSALDVIYDCNATGTGISTLEARLANRLAIAPPAGAPPAFVSVTLERPRDSAWGIDVVSFEEFVTFSASLRALIVGARPANGVDLGRPEDAPAAGVDAAELTARADAAANALTAAAASVEGLLTPNPSGDTRAVLRANDRLAAFGLLPSGSVSDKADLVSALAQASTLLNLAKVRLAKVVKLRATQRPVTDPNDDYDLANLAAVFGDDFRALPVVHASNAAVLTSAYAAGSALQGGSPTEAWSWVRRTAIVRAPLARLAETLLFTQALGTGNESDVRVAQIPYVPGSTWIGLAGTLPSAPTTGLLAHMREDIDFSAGVAGLFVDEWSEVVPGDTQITGIAFQSSTPGARPPQCILLAVSPDPNKPWDLETFEAILNETLDLAQQRVVDLDTLPWMGHFLPATYIADSALNTTIGVPFRDIVAQANKAFQAKLAQAGP